MAYAVFEDLDLTEFANHIPSLSFEVEADEAPVSAAAIIDDLGAITGLAPSLSPGEATPLRGFGIASGGSVRSVLETLATVDPLTILDDGTATAVSLRRIPDAIDLSRQEIGREHVWTPVTNAHLGCRLLLEKNKNNHTNTEHIHD